MKAKCPNCGKVFQLKGHADGKKSARQLTAAQMRASIAKMTRDLKEMKAIYEESRVSSSRR